MQIVVNPVYKVTGKIFRCQCTAQISGQGNSNLYGGKKSGRVCYQLQKFYGMRVSFLFQFM